jgi:hypothetical protein
VEIPPPQCLSFPFITLIPKQALRDYTSPRCEDIKVQESDSKLEATEYEIKSKIIEMAAATPFEGMATENPYRHIRHLMMLCNTVRQEGFPDEWFKWISFPTHLLVKQRHGNRLRPLKWKAIGTS